LQIIDLQGSAIWSVVSAAPGSLYVVCFLSFKTAVCVFVLYNLIYYFIKILPTLFEQVCD